MHPYQFNRLLGDIVILDNNAVLVTAQSQGRIIMTFKLECIERVLRDIAYLGKGLGDLIEGPRVQCLKLHG